MLPSAAAGVPYSFTLVPANNGFNYMLSSGNFGGILLASSTSTTLGGTASSPGRFSATVQAVGASGQAYQNYNINVLADINRVSVSGQVFGGSGYPLKGAIAQISGFDGSTYTTITNAFGYFRIEGVPAGLNGQFSVTSKLYSYEPRPILVSDVIEGLAVTPAPPAFGKK